MIVEVNSEQISLFDSLIQSRQFDDGTLRVLESVLISRDVKSLLDVRRSFREFMRRESVSVLREISQNSVDHKLLFVEFFVRAFAVIGDLEILPWSILFLQGRANSLLFSCGDDGRVRGWKWMDVLEADHDSLSQGDVLKPQLDLANPQHKGRWGALSPIPETNAIAVDSKVIAERLSEEEIGGLKQLFINLDTDNSGTITFDELRQGLKRVGSNLMESEIKELMDAADTDSSGILEYGEFLAATLHMNKIEREDNLLAAFSFFDKDGSGYITMDELQQACKDFGVRETQLDEMIKEVDQDSDGRIDYSEFTAMMRTGDNETFRLGEIKAWAPIRYYKDTVLPRLLEEKVIRISPFANRLSFDAPPAVQLLRCLTNYEDMVAFSCCVYDGGKREVEDMIAARERGWKGKFTKPGRVLQPDVNRINGKCPLTPLEIMPI